MSLLPLRMTFRFMSKGFNNQNVKVQMINQNYQNVIKISGFSTLSSDKNQSILSRQNNVMALADINKISARSLSIQEVTKNLRLFTNEPRSVEKDPVTLRLKKPVDKPVVLMLSWLVAKQKHLTKYAKLYMDQGYDVLVAQITPWQLLWPAKGSQVVAADLVKFLKNNEFNSPMILHGFSVGGYLWGECLVHIARDMENHRHILSRINGQVWDSAADITEIPVGVPSALFPNNETLRNALRKYMLYHLKTFHDAATTHYIRSSQMFHTNLCHAPALFLVSKTDPVGSVTSNQRVRESWESNGVNVTWKCWEKSPHVGHFSKHKEEYIESLFKHLRSLNMASYPEKLRAKL